jgi:hypothetical protein
LIKRTFLKKFALKSLRKKKYCERVKVSFLKKKEILKKTTLAEIVINVFFCNY